MCSSVNTFANATLIAISIVGATPNAAMPLHVVVVGLMRFNIEGSHDTFHVLFLFFFKML